MKFKMTSTNWRKSTPAVWRRIGETVLFLCGIVGGSVYASIPWVAVTVFIVGLLARGLVEFFISE